MSRLHDPWRATAVGVLAIAMLAACAAPAAPPTPSGAVPPAASAAAPVDSAPSTDSPPARQSLRVGFANVAAAHAPLYVALESGAFARRGLDVELTNLG